MKLFLAVAVLAALAPPAAAQKQARPEPANPAAPVPAFKYDSAFAGYRGYRDESLAQWRDANDEAARAGGHSGIFSGGHKAHDAAKPQRQQKSSPKPAPAEPGGAHKH